MLTRMTNAAGAMLICDGENEMFNDQVPKPILKTLHARKDPFALEMVSIGGGLRFYVRNRTKPDAELQALFVPVPGRPARDWLRLGQTRAVTYRVLALRQHALLPTFRSRDHENRETYASLTAVMTEHTRKHRSLDLGIRLLMQPAPPGWGQDFRGHFRGDENAPNPGLLQRIFGVEHQPNTRPADADQRHVNMKSSDIGFSCEVQVVVVCKDDRRENSTARTALDQFTDLVEETLGGAQVWERGRPVKIRRSQVRLTESDTFERSVGQWLLLRFQGPDRARDFPLLPKELEPLCPAPSPALQPDRVETIPPAAPPPVQPPVAETSDSSRYPSADDGGPETTTVVSDTDVGAGFAEEDPVDLVGPEPAHHAGPDAGDTRHHSAQPPGLPASSGLKQRRRRRSTRSRDIARAEEALESVRAEIAETLGLAGHHALAFDQLADVRWCTAQEFAGCFGRGPSATYDALTFLQERDLVANQFIGTGASAENRFWIPEDAWNRVMVDRPLPHGVEAVRRRRLNPDFTSAAYMLAATITQEAPGRQLRRFRWFGDEPCDGGAQFSDGWAAFLWSGVWEDEPALLERLRRCSTVFARWGSERNRARPGRLLWVVPTRWQSERVWRAARDGGWTRRCAVYVVEEDLLLGDLDLSSSLGGLPPFIMTTHWKPLPRYVDPFTDVLAGEQPDRVRRLLAVIERSPVISSADLQKVTRMNGSNMNRALSILSDPSQWQAHSSSKSYTGAAVKRPDLVRVLPTGEYIAGKAALSLAAHRDGVRPNVPVSRSNPDRVVEYPQRRLKKLAQTHSLLAKFASAGCPTVSGLFCRDGRFKPDGAVWIDEGPFGPGWHYVVNARGARGRRSVVRALRGVLSPNQADDYPFLVLCRPDMERSFWNVGDNLKMLTVSSARLRQGPIVGHTTVWLQHDHRVSLLSSRQTEGRNGTNA